MKKHPRRQKYPQEKGSASESRSSRREALQGSIVWRPEFDASFAGHNSRTFGRKPRPRRERNSEADPFSASETIPATCVEFSFLPLMHIL